MKSKFILVLTLLSICISLMPSNALAYRDYSESEQKANALNTLNLFKGVSENDFVEDLASARPTKPAAFAW